MNISSGFRTAGQGDTVELTDDTITSDILEFFDREFNRIDESRHNPVAKFSFLPLHVVKGTTDVWAKGHRSEKFPRSLAAKYGFALGELCKKQDLGKYRVTSEKRGRRMVYVVSRKQCQSTRN